MIRLLSLCMCILSLLGAFVFGAAKFPGFVAAAIFAVLFVFAGKVTRKKLFACAFGAGLVVALIIAMMTPSATIDGTATEYGARMEKAVAYIEKGKLESAKEELDYLREHFPQTDSLKTVEVLYFLGAGNVEEARQTVDYFENRTSRGYYEIKEMCMFADAENYSDYDFCNLYREAADNNPDWAYANLNAGICLMNLDEFQRAEYYLRIAYDCGELTYDIPYYLGLICCEQGRMEEGIDFFEESYYLGAPEECVQVMQYFLSKSKEEDRE